MNKVIHARQARSSKSSLFVAFALTAAVAVGLGLPDIAGAQATTGSIFGTAPVASGETVEVTGGAGIVRQVAVGANGRFLVTHLPLGTYTVNLRRDGKTIDTRAGVGIKVAAGTEVVFGGVKVQRMSAVQVTATSLPAIDVSQATSETVITHQQLQKLPLAHTAEAIALLAPGVISGTALFGNYVSIGGSSVTENAYYINGFNTTDPLSGFGGLALPYGAIAQQQVLQGGYGAAYGRSDGGVLSQVGKSGTNQWHFGAHVLWTPEATRGDPRSTYYVTGANKGKLFDDNKHDKSWETEYSAYVGGPLIKDRLFVFAAGEFTKDHGSTVERVSNQLKDQSRANDSRWYVDVNWNITNNNALEFTGASSTVSSRGKQYDYDNETHTEGAFNSNDADERARDVLYMAKYTGYLTDDLTLTALYGKMRHTYYEEIPGYDPTLPHIQNPDEQNPAVTGGQQLTNSQTVLRVGNPDHEARNSNLRIDLQWQIGDHTLTFGVDNQDVTDINDGMVTAGPGYAWQYGYQAVPTTPIVGTAATDPGDGSPYVDAPAGYPGGADGYFVSRYIFTNSATVETRQRAQYVQDAWRIGDRWRVRIGLRNDQFTNYNARHVPYVRLTKPQWAPRLGFSWDVNGDSSLKIYGTAGRYYLALPASVALRAAGSTTYTHEYYTYTGVGPDGQPTGLTAIHSSTGGPISSKLEYGIPRDARTVAAANLKSEYQDGYILGFDRKLNSAWVFGAKASYRKLRNAIDNVDDAFAIADKMVAMGMIDPATAAGYLSGGEINGSYLFNPGRTNVFMVTNPAGGYYAVPMSMQDFHFNTTLKRQYYALELYLEHPFDGKWFGKIDYVFSRSYGNSEGQVRSDFGQGDVSESLDWDYWQVMDYATGELPNSRRHQIKAYGYYQVTPEWMVSGNLSILSGMPQSCLGLYGPGKTNPGLGEGAFYHWCNGKPWVPGKTHNSWVYTVDVGMQYRPAWANHKLTLGLQVFNLFNRRAITQTVPNYTSSRYLQAWSFQQPRYVVFQAGYDF